MKNFLFSLILTALLSFVTQLFLPWWVVAPIAFLVALLFKQSGFAAFLSGFLAIFLLWVVYAYTLSSANDHLLAGKVTELLKQLTGGGVTGLLVFTGLVGGLVAGFAALTGRMTMQMLDK